jgi:regulator of sigma E protease
MVFATVARVRGRPLSTQFVATAQSLFAILLLSMVLYVTIFGDIRRIWRDRTAEAQAKEAAAEEQKKAEQKKGEPTPAKP